MASGLNRHQMPVYLLRKQYEDTKDLKKTIKEEYGFTIPLTEILRDSLELFLKDMEREEALNEYLESKGWL